MYIIHIVGMVLCMGKECYVISILEFFYVKIIIFPIIFGGHDYFRWSDPSSKLAVGTQYRNTDSFV